MIRGVLRITCEVASIAVTARIVCGRRLAGPCPHCRARNQKAIDLAAREALAGHREEAIVDEVDSGIDQIRAYLTGRDEATH